MSKRTWTKRFAAGMLSLALAVTMVPADKISAAGTEGPAKAEMQTGETSEIYYNYEELEDGTLEITGYGMEGEDVEPTSLTIPETIDGKRVTHLGYSAFGFSGELVSVTLPNSIVSIGGAAFDGCKKLQDIIIPDSVRIIGDYAFYSCTSLNQIVIPDSVVSIGTYAFTNCSNLTSITLPYNLPSIADGMLSWCEKLEKVIIPDRVTRIGEEAFSSCSMLKKVVMPEGLQEIGISAFKDCISLEEVVIPPSVTSIKERAFYYCTSLTEVTMPASVTEIGECAFLLCTGLSKIVIPEGVTSIGAEAFGLCGLKQISIPTSVVSIGNDAFSCCFELSVYYAGTVEAWNNIVFDRTQNEELVYAKIYYNADGIPEGCPHTTITYINKKNPTCTAAGYTGDEMCVVCTEIVKQGIVLPATGHNPVAIVTKATLGKNGAVITKCSQGGEIISEKTIYYPKTIKLSKTSFTYNGKNQNPSIVVTDNNGKPISSQNYTVTYQNNRNVGAATAIIAFCGNYSGTITKTFNIQPKATTISKVSAQRKGLKAVWKKQTNQTNGYQLQYCMQKNFKGAKTVTISKNKTTAKSIAKLKAGKKYYVRIRTFKNVKLNGKNTKICSNWSKARTVTTRR